MTMLIHLSLTAVEIINDTGRAICLSNFVNFEDQMDKENIYLSNDEFSKIYRRDDVKRFTIDIQLSFDHFDMDSFQIKDMNNDSRIRLYFDDNKKFATQLLPPAYEEPEFTSINELQDLPPSYESSNFNFTANYYVEDFAAQVNKKSKRKKRRCIVS